MTLRTAVTRGGVARGVYRDGFHPPRERLGVAQRVERSQHLHERIMNEICEFGIVLWTEDATQHAFDQRSISIEQRRTGPGMSPPGAHR